MNVVRFLGLFKFLSDRRLLELYPPFFLMGVRIRDVHPQYRSMKAILPLRWYGKNFHGTMYGGFIASVSDPLAALLCLKIFRKVEVWTKKHEVEFLRPAKSELTFMVEVSEQDVQEIQTQLDKEGRATHEFSFPCVDRHGRVIAQIRNQVFLRLRRKREKDSHATTILDVEV